MGQIFNIEKLKLSKSIFPYKLISVSFNVYDQNIKLFKIFTFPWRLRPKKCFHLRTVKKQSTISEGSM